MFNVVISEKGGSSRVMEFDKPEVTIGRVQGNDIILPKGNVSKRHSRIVLKDSKFIIVDLKSTNGTYVNGRKITSPYILKENDKIYIGDFTLTMDDEAQAEAPPPPPPPPPRPARRHPPEPKVEAPPPPEDDFEEFLAPEDDGALEDFSDFDPADAEPNFADDDNFPPEPEFEPEPPLDPLHDDASFGDDLVGADFDPAPPTAPPPPAPPRVAIKKAPRGREPSSPSARKQPPSKQQRIPVSAAAQQAVFAALVKKGQWQKLAHDPKLAEEEVRKALQTIGRLPSKADPERIVSMVVSELVGLGPLEALLNDSEVSQIFANEPHRLFVERAGELEQCVDSFSCDSSMRFVIERLLSSARSVPAEAAVIIDTRLSNGAHLHAVLPPAAPTPVFALRKSTQPTATLDRLVEAQVLSQNMAAFLRVCVEHRRNIVISSSNGSDGNALLRAVASCIPEDERVVCIEEVSQLNLAHSNLVQLEAAPSVGVSLRDLSRQAVRLAPDRVVVGACRGGEALDILEILGGGVDGGMVMVHGHSVRDSISRLEAMMLLGSVDVSARGLREMIASATDIIVQISRFTGGVPKVTEISAVTGTEVDLVTTQEIFSFNSRQLDADGSPIGDFVASGAIPRFYEDLQRRGHKLDRGIFR